MYQHKTEPALNNNSRVWTFRVKNAFVPVKNYKSLKMYGSVSQIVCYSTLVCYEALPSVSREF